jgi:purine-binding chemotaxis protein CheW
LKFIRAQCSNALETELIIGLGTVQNGDSPRMLILLDIQKLMSSADMGLVSQAMH